MNDKSLLKAQAAARAKLLGTPGARVTAGAGGSVDRRELFRRAKAAGIPNYSRLSNAELVKRLEG